MPLEAMTIFIAIVSRALMVPCPESGALPTRPHLICITALPDKAPFLWLFLDENPESY